MILARFIFEIAGSPKKFVEDFANRLLAELRGISYLDIQKEYIAEPKETEQQNKVKLWTTFIELEGKFKDLDSLFNFILDYSPSSIEIIEPEKFTLSNFDLNRYLNDITHRIIALMFKINSLVAENKLLKSKVGRFRIKKS